MLLFLLICQWRVCKIVCNFQHYFGGRSKRESSCLEIRSSAQFLREIWISCFARRILEGVFVGGIVNIRNECLFFSVHGKWIAVRNKQIAWTANKKRHSFLNYPWLQVYLNHLLVQVIAVNIVRNERIQWHRVIILKALLIREVIGCDRERGGNCKGFPVHTYNT